MELTTYSIKKGYPLIFFPIICHKMTSRTPPHIGAMLSLHLSWLYNSILHCITASSFLQNGKTENTQYTCKASSTVPVQLSLLILSWFHCVKIKNPLPSTIYKKFCPFWIHHFLKTSHSMMPSLKQESVQNFMHMKFTAVGDTCTWYNSINPPKRSSVS
jgi:hypothetical protein